MPRDEYGQRMQALRRPTSYSTSKDRFSQPITARVREDVAAQPVEQEPSVYARLTDAEKQQLARLTDDERRQLYDEWRLARQEPRRNQPTE